MGINVSGDKVKLWIDEREGRDGNKWRQYRISASGKFDDEWVYSYIEVRFKRDIDVSNVSNGAIFNFEGFMTTKKPWTNKDGKEVKEPMIMITSADFGDLEDYGDSFTQAEEDIPF